MRLTDKILNERKPILNGKRVKTNRYKFGNIKEVIDIPDLVEVQKSSFQAFLNEGIEEVLKDYSPIVDYSDRFELNFVGHYFEDKPKYNEKECRIRDATYALPLHVRVQLLKKETGEVIEQDVFLGDFPMMTDSGSFIINGAERVVVSQLVRSPGSYNDRTIEKNGKPLYSTTVIPSRGAWIELKQDASDVLWISVDRKRKLCATIVLRALGLGSNYAIREVFGDNNRIINATLEKDNVKDEFGGLTELYRRLSPGEAPGPDALKKKVYDIFFDSRRYDIAKVGRYKFNKKLNLAYRLPGQEICDDIYSQETGEIIAKAGEIITEEKAFEIQNSGVKDVYVYVNDEVDGRIRHKIISNHTVDFSAIFPDKNRKTYGLLPTIYYPAYEFMREIAEECDGMDVDEIAEKYKEKINAYYYTSEGVITPETDTFEAQRARTHRAENRIKFVVACQKMWQLLNSDIEKISSDDKQIVMPILEKLNHKHITLDDIIAAISSNLDLVYNIGTIDNIDHLGNRRVRSVGELLTNQLRIGISRLEKLIREHMQTQSADVVTPQSLINVRPVSAEISKFFGSSQLSQFMEQINPAAELTNKRKLSALGPGGLNRERATFEVRDVHHTHYGRLCPIETPEGQNIGLITSLATYAKINEFGFIETPYRKVEHDENGQSIVTDKVDYLAADIEDRYIVAQANEPLTEDNRFVNDRVGCRHASLITQYDSKKVDYMDVSPKQLVSVATALIPFLENDDTNRALMGSNMQRQAVPLVMPDSPMVGTGIEATIAKDSGVLIFAEEAGTVTHVSSDKIIIREESGFEKEYTLKKFVRSNANTCLNQRPIVNTGDMVIKGEVIADGPSTQNGELALGRNVLVAYMEWEGYNYEDAILINEKLVQDDVFTSIHIEELEIEARDTKLGPEEITRDIPSVGEDALKDLDENGIIRIGAEVHPKDILVGKTSPKGELDPSPEDRLLRAIYGEKSRDVRDTSLRVSNGEGGIVVDVKVFTRENKDELQPGVNKLVRVYIAQKRKIQVGDKMAGRHGNKGVVSRVLPQADMPYLEDGTPLDIVLNPLGVPSRMNIGQVLEVHLGQICRLLTLENKKKAEEQGLESYEVVKIATPVFDGATEKNISQLFNENGLVNNEGKVDGKFKIYDGRTGEEFENKVTIGVQYMIKLIHLVDDKIHARSIGPYSLVTQQPLGGKAQFGGQRFGEMEVWALEAYGASHILQEILTVKSDDVIGRTNTFERIVHGQNIAEPSIPEAFKVLLKEIQAIGLDVKVLGSDNKEMVIRELDEREYETPTAAERTKAEKDKAIVVEEVEIVKDNYDNPDKKDTNIDYDLNDILDNDDDEDDYVISGTSQDNDFIKVTNAYDDENIDDEDDDDLLSLSTIYDTDED